MSVPSQSAERASSGWKVTYSSFLTGLLAFFLLLIFKAEHEAESTFKFADKMKDVVYKQVLREKQKRGLDWLYIEHAGSKGMKLLIPSEIGNQSFFKSGDDRIENNFLEYLETVAEIVSSLELEKIPSKYSDIILRMNGNGKTIKIKVRIEGHSDTVPLGNSSEFRDNWDLSTARAHQVMQFFMTQTPVPDEFFSISGYGSFHPLVDVNRHDENRRVEIYLDIQMIELENGSHV